MKSFLTSKTVIINAIVTIGSLAAIVTGVLPTEIAGYIVAAVAALNVALRFVTNGAVSIALPANVPAMPPVLQAAMTAFEQVVATLPPEVGPARARPRDGRCGRSGIERVRAVRVCIQLVTERVPRSGNKCSPWVNRGPGGPGQSGSGHGCHCWLVQQC